MEDISLHMLDIVENSIRAGATLIEITIDENLKKNCLTLRVRDNGSGIEKKSVNKVLDPFYTTKRGKKIGLGISLLAQSVREADGKLDIKSLKGKGTVVAATFAYNHIDRKPLGKISDTIMALISANGIRTDFIYRHKKDGHSFMIDTKTIKKYLKNIPINNPDVMQQLRKELKGALSKIGSEQY